MWQWITDNWQGIFAVAGAAHVLALAVVNLTPTPKDDEVYGKFYKWIERIGGILGPRAKQ